MKANQPKSLSSLLIPLMLLASLFTLAALIYLWPSEAPKQTKDKVTLLKVNARKPLPSTNRVPLEIVAPQKKKSPAIKGLGASLAESPLPKASSKLSLPKDLSLGEHLIQLKGGEWRLRIMLTLSSDVPEFTRFASPLKRRLIQMLFFLVHHRAPEALRMPSAEERLIADLKTRFSNVLKKQEFEIYIDSFSLEEIEFLPE